MTRHALALAAVVFLTARPAAAQGEIFLATLSFPGEIAEWYGKEYERVDELCSYPDPACWTRELRHKTWILNPVHSAPDEKAPQTGVLVVMSAYEPGYLHLRFDYRPFTGTYRTWLDGEEIGDWGYGIHVVVRGKGDPSQGDHAPWIQLGGVPGPAWIRLKPLRLNEKPRELTGGFSRLEGEVLRVDRAIGATNRRTGQRVVLGAQTQYVVERVTGDQVLLRQEVGADMSCGNEKDEKDVVTSATPRYRVPIDSLFGKDGQPLLSYAYPRGC